MKKSRLIVGLSLVMGSGHLVAAHATIDHAPWDKLLQRVVAKGRVDYDGVQAERETLERYLSSLNAVDPDALPTKANKLAFWINAYNACVVKGVLDHRPLKSVKDVKGFFDAIRYPVGGQTLTLSELEERGRALGDWRIHFALVCASSSCPPLRPEAYAPERLETQLIEQTTSFLNDPNRGLRISGTTMWLSKIFHWYAADFVSAKKLSAFKRLTPELLLPILSPYVAPDIARPIRGQVLEIRYLDYDWSLNAR